MPVRMLSSLTQRPPRHANPHMVPSGHTHTISLSFLILSRLIAHPYRVLQECTWHATLQRCDFRCKIQQLGCFLCRYALPSSLTNISFQSLTEMYNPKICIVFISTLLGIGMISSAVYNKDGADAVCFFLLLLLRTSLSCTFKYLPGFTSPHHAWNQILSQCVTSHVAGNGSEVLLSWSLFWIDLR